jgi:hypothetical protein
MAKAIESFIGFDSYCHRIEVAIREDGQWFSRSYGYNGYGNCWGKWTKDKELPRLENGCVEWGFKTLQPISPKGIRLPN